MCISEGMAIAPWNVLGGGRFKPKAEGERDGMRNISVGKQDRDESVRDVLEGIAQKKDTLATSVALAYVLHKAPYVFPIVGGRKVDHLRSNVKALTLRLDEEDMQVIESAYDFELGFPYDLLAGANKMVVGPQDVASNGRHGYFDFVQSVKPIPPHEGSLDRRSSSKPLGEKTK